MMLAPRRTTLLIVGAILVTLATGLLAGRMLEIYDQGIGFQQEADRIASVLELRPGMNVGDVRAGAGRWSVDLARRVGTGGMVYATSGPISPPHVLFKTVADAAVDNVTVITRAPDDQSRLPENCCDAVLLRHVYRGFEDRVGITRRLSENVRPGGRVLIIERVDSISPSMPGGTLLSPQQVIEEFGLAGFEHAATYTDWGSGTYAVLVRKPPATS